MIGVVLGFLLKSLITLEQTSDPLIISDLVPVPVEVMPDLNCPKDNISTPTTNGDLALNYKYLIEWRANCINSIISESERIENGE